MQIELNLSNPSFTFLHRAGLAGLWMTLKQLEKEKVIVPQGLTWELSRRGVILNWEGNDKVALEWLLSESFQINDGLISLRGLDSQTMIKYAQIILHQGILGTFLQHNSTHKSLGVKTESLRLDEIEIPVTYKMLQSYVYQEFAIALCDKEGKFLTKPISVAGWLNPGAVVRHIAFSADTSFQESPENALILLFAPIACYYYILHSQLRDKRALYALVIPEIIDLEKFAQKKQQDKARLATYKDFHACSLGDAALRFLTDETTTEIARKFYVPRCQVLTLGSVPWATQQKTRTDLYLVEATDQVCQTYKVCRNELRDRDIAGKKGGFIAPSFARELICENLARGKPWYSGIADKVNSNELFQKLTYERGGLFRMIEKVDWDELERLFVQACHEAIRYTYGKVAKNTKEGDVLNFERVTIRIRTGLGRCKNSETFREFMMDFWSRAGRIPTLQEHWSDLRKLVMDEKQWKKGRDLALLALASYKGKETTDKEENLDSNPLEKMTNEDEDSIGLPWLND
jgi:CRISPR-associated protein Cas8a1/Csx13